jgi:pSer/pThr/pTyr-binding forkhead associated (FHA) protein
LIDIVHCDGRKEQVALLPGSYTVGRMHADLTLAGDRNLSRRHAQLDILHKVVRIHDLGSTCGTFDASGVRVEAPHALRSGDWVRLGRTQLHVAQVAQIAATDASSATALTNPELDLDLGDA